MMVAVATGSMGSPQFPPAAPDQRRWIRLYFNNVNFAPETVTVGVKQYFEDRYPHYSFWQERPVYTNDDRNTAWFYVYLSDPYRRAPGHHWVYIYNEANQKVAEMEYQVVP